MKNVVFVVCVAMILGCSGQAPEGEQSVTTDGNRGEAIFVEGFEDGGDIELEVPPHDALPLSEIVKQLEDVGYTQIIDVEFEDGVWEVDHVVDGEERELHVDPMTGEILPDEQPKTGDD